MIDKADFKKKANLDFYEFKLCLKSLLVNSSLFQTLIGYLANPNNFSTQNSIF